MADATTYNFIGEVVAKAAGDIFDKEELFSTVWEEVVDEAIFRPRGIASKSRAALSAKAAEDARARSPNLAAYPFVWPRRLDAVPFPISSGTLLGPVALSPYARHNRSFTIVQHAAVWKPNLQPDFNVSVIERFGPDFFAGLRELDESDRSVQKSAESTSM
jgi:hypothetical protein